MDFKFNYYINLTSNVLGTKVLYCSDDFFADATRMLKPSPPVFIADKYDNNGKWMDGWESRRRRDGGNDFCFLKLGNKSIVKGFNINTMHFSGNHAPAISILGCSIEDDKNIVTNKRINWLSLLDKTKLIEDSNNFFDATDNKEVTHLKITIYPDGGIARLITYGNICFDDSLYKKTSVNVIAITTGAKVIYVNNEHFGKLANILSEHKPLSMADGWETRRRRTSGNDFAIIEFAKPATIRKIIVDTSFFKGNYPDSFVISAQYIKNLDYKVINLQSNFWHKLASQHKLSANCVHTIKVDNTYKNQVFTHVRFDIFPDGGVARLKLMGRFIK